jgi:hypothetical protein
MKTNKKKKKKTISKSKVNFKFKNPFDILIIKNEMNTKKKGHHKSSLASQIINKNSRY